MLTSGCFGDGRRGLEAVLGSLDVGLGLALLLQLLRRGVLDVAGQDCNRIVGLVAVALLAEFEDVAERVA